MGKGKQQTLHHLLSPSPTYFFMTEHKIQTVSGCQSQWTKHSIKFLARRTTDYQMCGMVYTGWSTDLSGLSKGKFGDGNHGERAGCVKGAFCTNRIFSSSECLLRGLCPRRIPHTNHQKSLNHHSIREESMMLLTHLNVLKLHLSSLYPCQGNYMFSFSRTYPLFTSYLLGKNFSVLLFHRSRQNVAFL